MKLAIIGSYGHVGVVLEGVARVADVKLVAAARWGKDDPMAFVGRHAAAPANLPVHEDYRRMLDDVRPDAVGVFMPLYRNAEASIAAAEHGCHVVCEKPLATTLDDLSALRRAVEKNKVRVAALLNMRCEPAYQAVRSAVREGRIGEPVLACGQKSYPFAQRDDFYKDRRTYGGSIPWAAIHALDFVSWCAGKDYARVAAMHSNAAHPTHPGMEDNGAILLEFAKPRLRAADAQEGGQTQAGKGGGAFPGWSRGGHAVIWFDYLRPWKAGVNRRWGDDRLRIVGTEGIVEVVQEGTRAILMTPTAVEDLPLPTPRDLFAEFVASVQGKGECIISPEESFRITEVALKARDAADAGGIVDC